MAKYTINHRCGHSQVVQMYGKVVDRERKAEWMEQGLCPECWRKEQLENAMKDTTPVTIKVGLNTANLSDNKKIIINAIATGGTYQKKEELKFFGFCFGDAPMGGLFGLFDKPQKVWYKIIEVSTIEEITNAIKFGDFSVVNDISEIDLIAMIEKIKKIDEENKNTIENKKKIGKSPVQIWIEENYNGKYWNGKIYDSGVKYNKPARIYINNEEINLPNDVYTAQIEWRKHRDTINMENK